MAGENELDRPLLALLDENTARAREAGQVRWLAALRFQYESLEGFTRCSGMLVAIIDDCWTDRAIRSPA